MSTVAERFNRRLMEINKSQSDVARAINVSPTAITKIANGETKRSKYLPDIARYLKVSEQWLMFGNESNAELVEAQVDSWSDGTPMPDDMVAVPFLNGNSLSAGVGALNSDIPYTGAKLWYSKSFLRRKGAQQEAVFCITVKGDSMTPTFDEGGIVMINSLDKTIVDGKPYAIRYQDQDYIKYLRRMPDDKVGVVSENEDYPPFSVNIEEISIIGRVIEYSKEW